MQRHPAAFLEVIAFYNTKVFTLDGEQYKRLMQPDLPERVREWYLYKSFYLSCRREIDARLFTRTLFNDLKAGFNLMAPLYQYLWEIKQEVKLENRISN